MEDIAQHITMFLVGAVLFWVGRCVGYSAGVEECIRKVKEKMSEKGDRK